MITGKHLSEQHQLENHESCLAFYASKWPDSMTEQGAEFFATSSEGLNIQETEVEQPNQASKDCTYHIVDSHSVWLDYPKLSRTFSPLSHSTTL